MSASSRRTGSAACDPHDAAPCARIESSLTASFVGSISMQTGLSDGDARQPRRSRKELVSQDANDIRLPQVGIANESDQVT